MTLDVSAYFDVLTIPIYQTAVTRIFRAVLSSIQLPMTVSTASPSFRIVCSALFVALLPLGSRGQGTLADYQRAERLNGAFQNKVYNAP